MKRITPASYTLPVFVFFLLLPLLSTAQSSSGLDSSDLSSVRSADISDQQLRSYIMRAREEGISETEAFQMAQARGLPASEAAALRSRVQELSTESTGDDGVITRSDSSGSPGVDDEQTASVSVQPPPQSRVFGSRIFRSTQSLFTPTMKIPTPANYVLGPGDELVIHIWGAATNQHRLDVSPEGTVFLDNLGPVYVSGLSIQEARDRLMAQLPRLYMGLDPENRNPDTFAEISLGDIRSIQVTVAGGVHRPGDYTVSSLSTLYNALYKAGGPTDEGSFRRIQLIRNSEVISELDLYDFLLRGDQRDNLRLRDQDVVLVQPYVQRVEVSGEMRRTGLFELLEGESLEDLFEIAGSFTDEAYTRQFRIHRISDRERRLLTVEQEETATFEMQSGDHLFVDAILDRFENRVRISGSVWRPGAFELVEGMTLADLIGEAEGLRPDAFLHRGLIFRVREDFSLEQIAVDLWKLAEDPEQHDVSLQPEDQVLIQNRYDMRDERTVSISGAVQEPGSMEFREEMTLSDLILRASGFRDAASESRIEISRRIIGESAPDQRGQQLAEVVQFEVGRDLELSEEGREFRLEPFDQVYVHQRPDYEPQRSVRIEGQVLYPGTYTIQHRGERISDLIERAGGLTNEAYIHGARLVRQTSEIDRASFAFQAVGENELIDSTSSDSLEISRIPIELPSLLQDPESKDNLFLRAGDVITIPEEVQTVRVAGAVMQEVEVRYRDGMNFNDYIRQAGGFTDRALKRRSYIVYANGEVDRSRKYLFGLITNRPEILPGAEIIVPEEPPREDGMSTGEVISISSTVVSMLATLTIALDRLSR